LAINAKTIKDLKARLLFEGNNWINEGKLAKTAIKQQLKSRII